MTKLISKLELYHVVTELSEDLPFRSRSEVKKAAKEYLVSKDPDWRRKEYGEEAYVQEYLERQHKL